MSWPCRAGPADLRVPGRFGGGAIRTAGRRAPQSSNIGCAVGVEAAGHRDASSGFSSVLLYLMLYAVLVIGTFGVVTLVGRDGDSAHELEDYRGLGKQRPALALALSATSSRLVPAPPPLKVPMTVPS